MAQWLDTVRLDRTKRPYIPQNRTVRAVVVTAAAETAATATTIRKHRINLTILLPLLLFIYFITATSDGFHETKMKHQINTAVRYNNINRNSAVYSTILATATAITITSGSNSNSNNTYGLGRTGELQR